MISPIKPPARDRKDMSEKEVKTLLRSAGVGWKAFSAFMRGQTCPIMSDGSIGYFRWDVERFIKYKGNPDNEPSCDFD